MVGLRLAAVALQLAAAQGAARGASGDKAKKGSSRPVTTVAMRDMRSSSRGSSQSRGASSMRGSVAAGSSSGSARHRKLSVPAPTYWGTKDCKHWPQFHLQDYQPESNEDYLESYGLGDILPLADVTIVGLYFADSAECRTQAIRQNDLAADIAKSDPDLVVHNVMLNYYMPMSCLEKECVPSWYNYPFFMPWYTDQCYGYVGGCSSTDAALTLDNWQLMLSNVTTIPLFQDTEWDNIWDDFGGGRGDVLIYDGIGRLYSYVSETPGSSGFPASGAPLTNDTVYDFVKTQAIAAGRSNGTERCKTFKDDDNPTPINYDDVWQYYYYSEEDDDDNSSAKKKSDDDDADDDKSSKKKKSDDDDDDDDDDKDATATSAGDAASAAATDDGWRPGLHNAGDDDADDDDVFWSGKHSKKTYKGYGTEKSKGIPSYVTASLIAVLAFAISAGIFWLRRRYYQENGTVGSTYGYGKLPMADGSGVVADTQLEVEMRAPGVGTASPARGSKDDGSYGSL